MTSELTSDDAVSTPSTTPLTSQGQPDDMSSSSALMSRPRWTLSEAAERSDASRSTLRRRLSAGAFPQATKDPERGWLIGVEDLLAAGIKLHRPIVEDAPTPLSTPPTTQAHALVEPGSDPAHALTAEVERLRAELAERDHREQLRAAELAVERAQRAAAEQLAADRERHIDDLRTAMRMLEAGPRPAERVIDVREPATSDGGVEPPSQSGSSASSASVRETFTTPEPRRGFLARLRGR